METGGPDELHFGLPEEIEAALSSEVDDWEEWQLEGMVGEAAFAVEERITLELAAQSPVDQETMRVTLAFMAEESDWGIDEPLTAADFIFSDEDDL
jgi:hypothetical protein